MLYGFKIRWLNIRDEWSVPKTRGLRMGQLETNGAVGNGIVGESVGESVGDNAADVNTDVGIES